MCVGHIWPVFQCMLEGIFRLGQSSLLSKDVAKVSQGCKKWQILGFSILLCLLCMCQKRDLWGFV